LERTKLRAQATIVDFEAGRNTSKARLELEEQRLKKWLDQIAKARIVSKWSGMVVYSRVESGRMGMGEPIQKGSQVRERQEILTIPRTGGMIAEASIHESVLKQVLPDLPCTLSIDAMPGQSFTGRVHFVALLPDKGSWWANPNQRLYKTEITLDEVNPEMRPGMSCNIEILTQEIPDALFVPLQSILTQKGDTIAFVSNGEEIEQRKVKVGRANDKWVEVSDGLKEGEVVLLSPPPGFVPEGKEQGEPVGPAADHGAGGDHGRRPAGASDTKAAATHAAVANDPKNSADRRPSETVAASASSSTTSASTSAVSSVPAAANNGSSAASNSPSGASGVAGAASDVSGARPAVAQDEATTKPRAGAQGDRTDGASPGRKRGAGGERVQDGAAKESSTVEPATDKSNAAATGAAHGNQR
jgi:hypothetical protein